MRAVSREFMLGRLVALWDAGAHFEIRGWYRWEADAIIGTYDATGPHPFPACSAVLAAAAVSPRIRWDQVKGALPGLLTGKDGGPWIGRNGAKARDILDRGLVDPREVFPFATSPKLHHFARALCGDRSAVTVDVWSARAVGLDPERLTPRRVRDAVAAHRCLARTVGVDPREVQSRIWSFVRSRPGRLSVGVE